MWIISIRLKWRQGQDSSFLFHFPYSPPSFFSLYTQHRYCMSNSLSIFVLLMLLLMVHLTIMQIMQRNLSCFGWFLFLVSFNLFHSPPNECFMCLPVIFSTGRFSHFLSLRSFSCDWSNIMLTIYAHILMDAV